MNPVSKKTSVIIAGARDYHLPDNIEMWIVWLFADLRKEGYQIELVSSGEPGIGDIAKRLAHKHNVPIQNFWSHRARDGENATGIRNRKMAKYADRIIALPSGEAVDSLCRECKIEEVTIYDFRDIRNPKVHVGKHNNRLVIS